MTQRNLQDVESAVSAEVAKRTEAITVEDIQRFICPLATTAEAYIFLKFCLAERLSPWTKEAYLIKYDEKSPAQIVVGIDAYVKRASRLDDFRGNDFGIAVVAKAEPETVTFRDGVMEWPGDTLIGGWALIKVRKGGHLDQRNRYTVGLKEYYQSLRGDGTKGALWKDKKATMIAKVALKQALKRTFGEIMDFQVEEDGKVRRIEVVIDAEVSPEDMRAIEAGEEITGVMGNCPEHKRAFILREGTNERGKYKFWGCQTKVGDGWCQKKPADWLSAELAPFGIVAAKPKDLSTLLKVPWADLEQEGYRAIVERVRVLKSAPPEGAPVVQSIDARPIPRKFTAAEWALAIEAELGMRVDAALDILGLKQVEQIEDLGVAFQRLEKHLEGSR